ncbi:MAG: hypothetical protein M0Z61_08860 [Nitrospiraceae bacterium]|nr:hypothetical protein [Nitrospiraceae bacterium]
MDKDELRGFCKTEFDKLKTLANMLSSFCSDDKTTYDLKETAAMGAFLFSVYQGVERVLEQLLIFDALGPVQAGNGRSEIILKKALELGIVPPELNPSLTGYLAFREFFSRSYVTDLNSQKICGLARNCEETVLRLEKEVFEYIDTV